MQNNDKQLLTVAEVARLYKKSVQTVYRNINSGKITRGNDGKIALSECLRAYGAMPDNEISHVKHDTSQNVNHSDNTVIEALNMQIGMLKRDLELSLEREKQGLEREKQAHEREQRLMLLLANFSENKSNSDKSTGGFFGGLFKR